MKTTKEIYLAGGCFWGTEHFVKQINGVLDTQTGYANGKEGIENPSYKTVCSNQSGFAETVKVIHDPQVIDLQFILELFFKTIDPTSYHKQGGDVGSQYRTGIYYTDSSDLSIIQSCIATLAKAYSEPILVEVLPLTSFYSAEDYHQDYLDKNPTGYCHIHPSLFEMARKARK